MNPADAISSSFLFNSSQTQALPGLHHEAVAKDCKRLTMPIEQFYDVVIPGAAAPDLPIPTHVPSVKSWQKGATCLVLSLQNGLQDFFAPVVGFSAIDKNLNDFRYSGQYDEFRNFITDTQACPWVFYNMGMLKVDIVSTSPLDSSGAIVCAHYCDPLCLPLEFVDSDLVPQNVHSLVSKDGSRIMNSLQSDHFVIDCTSELFTVHGANLRASHFGYFVIAVHTMPRPFSMMQFRIRVSGSIHYRELANIGDWTKYGYPMFKAISSVGPQRSLQGKESSVLFHIEFQFFIRRPNKDRKNYTVCIKLVRQLSSSLIVTIPEHPLDVHYTIDHLVVSSSDYAHLFELPEEIDGNKSKLRHSLESNDCFARSLYLRTLIHSQVETYV